MWRMQDGDRILTAAEWALFRIGLSDLWDFIENDIEHDDGLSETGIRVFDTLQPEQKIALLADVGQALCDSTIPTPTHTAANEGAIAAVFATIRLGLEVEMAAAADGDRKFVETRCLIRSAAAEADDRPRRLPSPTRKSQALWSELLQEIEERIFWDTDYAMGDEFLDLPPELAHQLLAQFSIDPEYFTAIPREPSKAELIHDRQTLAQLLGRSIMGAPECREPGRRDRRHS